MPQFRRPHHNAILSILSRLDGALFAEAQCYFGGGTAIVLQLDEYRESRDIDFLCASQDGYRLLRQKIWGVGFDGLVRPGETIPALRDIRADQYGIRTVLEADGTPIRFEIVREARISLDGAMDPDFGVPLLSRVDMYAEKLLANADRWADEAVFSRDIIDLAMMISRWGPIPEAAWEKARRAYGETVDAAFENARKQIQKSEWHTHCRSKLSIDHEIFLSFKNSRI